jgi:hypothetical protein
MFTGLNFRPGMSYRMTWPVIGVTDATFGQRMWYLCFMGDLIVYAV